MYVNNTFLIYSHSRNTLNAFRYMKVKYNIRYTRSTNYNRERT